MTLVGGGGREFVSRACGRHPGPMEQNLDKTIALLSRTPAVLSALLRELPEEWTHTNEGEGTWSAFDVVGHLIHCELTDWMPRARVVLQGGDGQPFPPFDRFGHVEWVKGKSLGELLDEFARLRTENLVELEGWKLTAEELGLHGLHPVLGSVTLSELFAAWAAHDLTHLHQITRVMAYQYRDAVGPFRRFQGVMQCGGHSAAN